MPRHISFALTTEQVLARTKTVTRRLGWKHLQPGTLLRGCRQCMGLAAGETVDVLCTIRVTDVRTEPLRAMLDDEAYGRAECAAEGFPNLTPVEFVDMFCHAMKCDRAMPVRRIEFAYVDEPQQLTLPE